MIETSTIDGTFDEIEVGTKYRSPGRTMTEADVVNFCMLTGNWLEVHSNAEFSKKTRFGQRLVQGSLVFSVIPGLLRFGPSVAAFYGVDKLRFLNPVFIGDTIRVEAEVVRKKEKDDKFGVTTVLFKTVNQRGETTQQSEFSVLMIRRREDIPKP
ncbi:MAG: dehydratase [Alphaproteobacteria bacterium]|nr:dehydratase [Alphaproteobacteria bacterium]